MLELAHPLDAVPQSSPLREARERRDLTVRAAALRSGLREEEIEWLEEGRIYRFPSQGAAILAAVVYGAALGVDKREAQKLAGLPVGRTIGVNAKARLIAVGAVAALLSALAVMVMTPDLRLTRTRTVEAIPNANLPAPWKLHINVENGTGDIAWTREVASRIGAMGYTIAHVGRADRFDYPRTSVYYGPGGHDVGLRLARQLGVPLAPATSPGLTARSLLVIVGPKTVAAAR
jgi:hypothetical protein